MSKDAKVRIGAAFALGLVVLMLVHLGSKEDETKPTKAEPSALGSAGKWGLPGYTGVTPPDRTEDSTLEEVNTDQLDDALRLIVKYKQDPMLHTREDDRKTVNRAEEILGQGGIAKVIEFVDEDVTGTASYDCSEGVFVVQRLSAPTSTWATVLYREVKRSQGGCREGDKAEILAAELRMFLVLYKHESLKAGYHPDNKWDKEFGPRMVETWKAFDEGRIEK